MKTFMVMMIGMVLLVGCTDYQRVRQSGGVGSFDLPKGQKLVSVSGNGVNLWYLVREMRSGEVAEVYEFCEKSGFGMIEGKVIIKEVK
jgi:hypothetical protein